LWESFRRLAQVAKASLPVLITGETGTGKEVTASAIHALGGGDGRLVGVNCGGIPTSLIEGELFGSAKGAFSGAIADRPGLIREANRGTLFLDEIAELPLASQAAFLRVLQDRRVRPVGGTHDIPVQFRLASATNQDIDERVRDGSFRNDLFARIAGFRIRLPPLRERREDLGLLVGTLLGRIDDTHSTTITLAAARAILAYDFPLNIRELENWLTAAAALSEGSPIDEAHFPEPMELAPPVERRTSKERRLTTEQEQHRSELVELLREHGGNVSAVARATGKARNQVQRWLHRYALRAEDFR
jgi:DNA-binding NtrC family response regulator